MEIKINNSGERERTKQMNQPIFLFGEHKTGTILNSLRSLFNQKTSLSAYTHTPTRTNSFVGNNFRLAFYLIQLRQKLFFSSHSLSLFLFSFIMNESVRRKTNKKTK